MGKENYCVIGNFTKLCLVINLISSGGVGGLWDGRDMCKWNWNEIQNLNWEIWRENVRVGGKMS